MNEAAVNSGGMAGKKIPGENWSATPKPDEGWSRSRWLTIFAFIFATHVALIFLFGQKKPIVPRSVKDAPTLKLAADGSGEWLALNDPTLFALPHPHDFTSATWLTMPDAKPPLFRWTEPPRWLPLSADSLGMALGRFTQTNFNHPLDFKPATLLSVPALPIEPLLPQNSTMRIEGALAQRQLPDQISLTNWPYDDVLGPCTVQVLADAAGNVISTVLLKSCGYETADERALEIVRALRFKPSTQLTIGRVIFNWHTVPTTASP